MSLRSPSGFIRPNYDPLEVADAPTAVTPSAGNQSASIDCTAPADVGGSAITSYYAVVNPGGFTGTSVTLPVSVTGLTNGTEYTAKVWANNSYGPSPYSAESAGFTPVPPFVEDVFSTYLYTGNGSTQTITNGIDLAGEGGMVWTKDRDVTRDNIIADTEQGTSIVLVTNSTGAAVTGQTAMVTAFNSDGYSAGLNINRSTEKFVSWTWRKAPKFFDVLTYAGNSTSGRTVSHNLGSVPGCIIIKSTTYAGTNWAVYHRSLTSNQYTLQLNNAGTELFKTAYWNSTTPTDTEFTLGNDTDVNQSGHSYVAYLFAHEAGGFGDTGTEDVISCGNFAVSSSSDGVVNLGWEPQFVIIKQATTGGSGNWYMFDNMRGIVTGGNDHKLYSNSNSAETFGSDIIDLSATGFTIKAGSVQGGTNYVYIAIRRPMKTPTAGTEVFAPVTYTGNGSTQIATTGFPVDAMIEFERTNSSGVPAAGGKYMTDRLRGSSAYLETSGASAEGTGFVFGLDNNTGVNLSSYFNSSSRTYIIEALRRAPGFFDVVAYTGNGTAGRTVAHNLGVAPEMIIVKDRDNGGVWGWSVYHKDIGNNYKLQLEAANAKSGPSSSYWNNTNPQATLFTLGDISTNWNGTNYIAYLFATLTGVSKVGSYTGTTSDINVDCGFSAGARFVLIKRTDSTGDWYVWDSARGIVAGNDPYLLLNSTAAEVTSTDYIDPLSAGFTVTSSAPAALNASGGTYIFLAIA